MSLGIFSSLHKANKDADRGQSRRARASPSHFNKPASTVSHGAGRSRRTTGKGAITWGGAGPTSTSILRGGGGLCQTGHAQSWTTAFSYSDFPELAYF